jgi:hypothetical protein
MKILNLVEQDSKQTNLFRIRLIHRPRFMKLISWILIFAILNTMGGCCNYFKVTTVPEPVAAKLSGFEKQGKVIILHFNDKAWILESSGVSDDKLTGTAAKEYISTYNKSINNKRNRYKTSIKNNQSHLLNEVHIYVIELARLSESHVSTPLSAIQRIELYEKNKSATTISHIIGYTAIALGPALVLYSAIIAADSIIALYDGWMIF